MKDRLGEMLTMTTGTKTRLAVQPTRPKWRAEVMSTAMETRRVVGRRTASHGGTARRVAKGTAYGGFIADVYLKGQALLRG
jgi:hypothetical protein